MSECRLTVRRDIGSRGRGLWCIEHQDWAPDYSQCRVSILTVRAEAAEAAIQRVRELHWPIPDSFDDRLYTCGHCGHGSDDWPCDTLQALDKTEPPAREGGVHAGGPG